MLNRPIETVKFLVSEMVKEKNPFSHWKKSVAVAAAALLSHPAHIPVPQ